MGEYLVDLTDGGAGPAILALPPISGSPYVYLGLATALGPSASFYAFAAPGFDDDADPLTSIPALADAFLPEAIDIVEERPTLVLGWSMGGATAAHLVLQLAARGIVPACLVVVDAPLPARQETPDERSSLLTFLYELSWLAAGGAPIELDGPQESLVAPEGATAPDILARLEQEGRLPDGLDADSVLPLYTMFRSHLIALAAYDLSTALPCPVVSVVATRTREETGRWRHVATTFEEHAVEGDHYTMWTGESLGALAAVLGSTAERYTGAEVRPR